MTEREPGFISTTSSSITTDSSCFSSVTFSFLISSSLTDFFFLALIVSVTISSIALSSNSCKRLFFNILSFFALIKTVLRHKTTNTKKPNIFFITNVYIYSINFLHHQGYRDILLPNYQEYLQPIPHRNILHRLISYLLHYQ